MIGGDHTPGQGGEKVGWKKKILRFDVIELPETCSKRDPRQERYDFLVEHPYSTLSRPLARKFAGPKGNGMWLTPDNVASPRIAPSHGEEKPLTMRRCEHTESAALPCGCGLRRRLMCGINYVRLPCERPLTHSLVQRLSWLGSKAWLGLSPKPVEEGTCRRCAWGPMPNA
jgi:hypothetical protein